MCTILLDVGPYYVVRRDRTPSRALRALRAFADDALHGIEDPVSDLDLDVARHHLARMTALCPVLQEVGARILADDQPVPHQLTSRSSRARSRTIGSEIDPRATVEMRPCDLYSASGFDDGDLLWDAAAWLRETEDALVNAPGLLRVTVRDLLAPALEPSPELRYVATAHNPVRAGSDGPNDAWPVAVPIPMAAILDAGRAYSSDVTRRISLLDSTLGRA